MNHIAYTTPSHIKQPIKFSYRFLQALFNTESDYFNRVSYRMRNNGSRRLAHHLTKADLQLAITLQKIVNNDGEIWLTNRHLIYQQLSEFFQAPVHKHQFYQAFEKFVFNRLISIEHQEGQTITIKLEQYLEDNGKLGRFIVLPELLYHREFSMLSIAEQKLYLFACGQQGDQHKKVLQHNLDRLYDLLHRSEPGHVKKLLTALTMPFGASQEPLLSVGKLETNVLGMPKLVYQVNPYWTAEYKKGDHGRVLMPIKKSFRRILARIEGYLSASGCTFSSLFHIKLAALLKDKSEKYISYVMARVVQLGNNTFLSAEQVLKQIQEELCDRMTGIRLLIAEQTGILAYIGKRSKKEFAEAFSGLRSHTFRQMCKLLLPPLQERYSRPGALGEADYRKPSDKMRELEQVIDMKQLRTIAYAQQLDPSAFIDMMQDAHTYWKQLNCSVDQLTRWIMAHMDKLPKWKPVADVPVDFNLIAFAREQAPQALLL